MREFEVKVRLIGYYTAEDPKCPMEWRGSGVYDIDVPCTIDAFCRVWASDAVAAYRMAEEFDYDRHKLNPYGITTDDVEILEVKDLGDKDPSDTEPDIEVFYTGFHEEERD